MKNPELPWMLLVILLFAANALSFGENAPCQKTPLIEVGYDAFGLVTPQGKYLYFRVCEDGLLTYEVEGVPMGTKVLRSEHVSASQLTALRQLMEQEDLRTLRGAFDAKPSVKDYRRVLDVRIRHVRDLQTFTLVDPLVGFEGKFPGPVVQLFCAIDKLRETEFKMSRECSP